MTRRLRIGAALALSLLALPLALKLLGFKLTNRARTDAASTDARLLPRHIKAAPADVREQVLALAPTLRTYGQPWRIASQDEAGGVFSIRCEVPVFFFIDDLTVTITPVESGSRVEVESAARVGQGDMGENARHIRQILSALDGLSEVAPR